MSLIVHICDRHTRVRDPRLVDEERFGSRDGRRSTHVSRARRRSVRPRPSDIGTAFRFFARSAFEVAASEALFREGGGAVKLLEAAGGTVGGAAGTTPGAT